LFELLQHSANLQTPSNEESITNKLLAILQYKKAHPDYFAQIETTYIYGVNSPEFRAPSSPFLKSEHVRPEYRLVWEYYFLKPADEKMSSLYDRRCADAIARIGNVLSLNTFDFVDSFTSVAGIPLENSLIDKKMLCITAIGKIPSANGLNMLTRIVSRYSKSSYDKSKDRWDPKKFIKEMFNGKQNLKTENRWRKIIREVKNKKSDERSRKMIKTLEL
jgi:hypothetical protein